MIVMAVLSSTLLRYRRIPPFFRATSATRSTTGNLRSVAVSWGSKKQPWLLYFLERHFFLGSNRGCVALTATSGVKCPTTLLYSHLGQQSELHCGCQESRVPCLGKRIRGFTTATPRGKKGIWLKLMAKDVGFVPLAFKEGFKYHHAEEDYVMLTRWLPETDSTLPANASHQVGIGAVIINDQNELLVVQEKSGPTQGSGVWKMPTGVVMQGENIKDAALREVKEETNVDVEFIEVLGIRQSHDVAFGKSDLFFLCFLQPLSSEIVIQEREIAAAQWMPLEEFRSQPFNSESSFLTRIADIIMATKEKEYQGFAPELLTFGFRKKGSYFYHNTKDIHKYLEQRSSKM